MGKHVTLLDGAQGTLLWRKAAEKGIEQAPVWTYNLKNPELVAEVCREYAAAGSEIICSNTFGVNRFSVERETSASAGEVVSAAVQIAKEALAGKNVRVALDIGPLPVLTEPYGDLSEEEAEEIFAEITAAGAAAGADCIFLETFLEMEMLRAAARAARRTGLPVLCSMSFEASGRTLFGVDTAQMIRELSPMGVAAVGMNCSLGPDLALPIIQAFAEKTDLPLIFKPNAGMPVTVPDGTVTYPVTPEEFAHDAAAALKTGRIAYLGGCCGTDPGFIRLLKELADTEADALQ